MIRKIQIPIRKTIDVDNKDIRKNGRNRKKAIK
jgi:hypothetical protein